MKTMIKTAAIALLLAITTAAQAGKTSGGTTTTTTTGAYNFTYKVTNPNGTLHVYGYACQVGATTQPKGTVLLGQAWVWDLGAVSSTGTATVSCPKPVTIKGQTATILGRLYFADSRDVGASTMRYTWGEVTRFTSKYYNGYASIEVVPNPNPSGEPLFWGPPPTPFAYDFSPYL